MSIVSMLVAEPLRQAALGLERPMPDYPIAARIDACLTALRAGLLAPGAGARLSSAVAITRVP
ncbi:MAG: hypothetical protein V4724_17690 [Pseudomonadota bacterium]